MGAVGSPRLLRGRDYRVRGTQPRYYTEVPSTIIRLAQQSRGGEGWRSATEGKLVAPQARIPGETGAVEGWGCSGGGSRPSPHHRLHHSPGSRRGARLLGMTRAAGGGRPPPSVGLSPRGGASGGGSPGGLRPGVEAGPDPFVLPVHSAHAQVAPDLSGGKRRRWGGPSAVGRPQSYKGAPAGGANKATREPDTMSETADPVTSGEGFRAPSLRSLCAVPSDIWRFLAAIPTVPSASWVPAKFHRGRPAALIHGVARRPAEKETSPERQGRGGRE